MEFVTIFIIAVSLAMDAFAVSIATGTTYKNFSVYNAVRMALFFAVFQGVMPLIGHVAGVAFSGYIVDFDHWIAFLLLAAIGCKMIHDARKHADEEHPDPAGMWVLLTLSVATSIDALAIGVTLSLVTSHIYVAVWAIGIITFLLSLAGCKAGQKIGHIFENKIEILAGLILIGIGIKILIQHLFFA
jgi:putative Mn2+ efflux pump MntP